MSTRFSARGSTGSGRWRSTNSATIAIISILCIIVVAHDLFRTWQDRVQRTEEIQREVANWSLSSAQYAEDAFQTASLVLTDLAERVEADGTAPAQLERLRQLMIRQVTAVPVLNSLGVVDDTGILLVNSLAYNNRMDDSDREYFEHHRTHPDRRVFVSPPLISRATGNPVIVLSKRINRADGSFGGVVAVSIDVAYFQSFYNAFDLGHDGAATMFRDDATLLLRRPASSLIGTKRLNIPPFNDPLGTASSGSVEVVSSLDGMTRFYAWHRVASYPLVVGVALGKDEQLAAWRANAGAHMLAAIVVVLLLGFLGGRHIRQVRSLNQAERDTAAAVAIADAAAARYRLLADNSSDMIVSMDAQLIRRYVSPGCRDLLGYEPEELVGQLATSLVHPEEYDLLASTLRRLATGQDRENILCRERHREGHWVWVDVSLKLIRDPVTGAPKEIQTAGRDVSERMKLLGALQQSEERFRLLLQSSSAVTEAIYMLDADGNVESWNAGAERIKGYTPKEIIGRHFSLFFTPEDIANGEPARELQTARNAGHYATEGWRVRKDGVRFLASVVVDAVRNADGSLRGFAKATRDITSQRIEEAQRAIIIEAAPNGMMIIDEAGIITLANSQVDHMFDYPPGSLIGQPLDVLLQADARATDSILGAAFASGRCDPGSLQRQFPGRKRDASAVTVEIMLSPVRTPRGRIVVAALFDVTERQRRTAEQQAAEQRERDAAAATNASLERLSRHLARARDRAEQASRAKSRFLAGISHELRTPLNGILGYAHLLHIEGGLNHSQAARVDAMLGAGRHLLEMINRVLDLSEIEADQLLLRPAALDLRSFAAACLDLVRPMAEAKALTLSLVVTPATPASLTADPTRLRQVLLNLLGNAAKFTSRGGVELRLKPAADPAGLRIEIVDTGPGIPADQRQRLFQDFERLETEATRLVEGAGLGLALSAHLAGLMGGSLGHEDNPGGGSIFWLELPLGAGGGSAAQPGSADPRADPPLRPMHALVVDDVAMNRDIASAFLRSAGHTVVCVEGGAEAVAAATATDFDVILMDVRMPGMDGLEATRRIRGLAGPRGWVPIVALTAQAFTEQVAACHAAGMDSHLSKPFDPNTLLAAVAQAVTARRMQDAVPAPPMPAPPMPAPPMPAPPVVGVELPVLDRTVFDRTAAYLPPEALDKHMRTIVDIGDGILQRLREPDALTHTDGPLADAAHTLAGSAGMFGFERVSTIGRRFELAVRTNSTDALILAQSLVTAIESTTQVIKEFKPAEV